MNWIQRLALIAVVATVFVYSHFVWDPTASPHAEITTLDELQKQALNLLLEETKLLFSLSTALFGLVGFFVLKFKNNGEGLSKESRRDAMLAFAFTALSISFGYILMDKWVELLATGGFAPFDPIVVRPRQLQIAAFLLALLFTASIALREIPKARK